MYKYFADTYNGTEHVDLAQYAQAGHSLLGVKASEGMAFVDAWHALRSRAAHAHGLTVLHYHFARPDEGNSPLTEAAFFTRVVKPLWVPGDYVCLDMERGVHGLSFDDVVWVEHFCRMVKRWLGATPIVYANESTLNGVLLDLRVPGERRWVARYDSAERAHIRRGSRWAEQFTDGSLGRAPRSAAGIGPCDMSELNRVTAVALRLRTLRRRWGHPDKAGH